MTQSPPPELDRPIPCHGCGYDVRAQPDDGRCPECETPVELSQRMSLIPRRPAWRDSDPRWRRRMVAGAWVLTLLPLIPVLDRTGWAASIPVPTFFAVQANQSLARAFTVNVSVHLMFCIGIVLLFSHERDRRKSPFDWTRRWGILLSYLVLLLGGIDTLCIVALVILGIAAIGHSLPRGYELGTTDLFVWLGYNWMRFAPHPSPLSEASLAIFSAVAVLLACVPLFTAMRISGPRVLPIIVLLPVALSALAQVANAALNVISTYTPLEAGLQILKWEAIYPHAFYFAPRILVARELPFAFRPTSTSAFFVELSKWLGLFSIAIWLTIAQLFAMFPRRDPRRPGL